MIAAAWRWLRRLTRSINRRVGVPETEVVLAPVARIRAARAAALGFLLAVLGNYALQLPAKLRVEVPAMAVSPLLFRVGQDLCRKNDGLRRIEIVLPVNDRYTFICVDGARFEDIMSTVKGR